MVGSDCTVASSPVTGLVVLLPFAAAVTVVVRAYCCLFVGGVKNKAVSRIYDRVALSLRSVSFTAIPEVTYCVTYAYIV